MDDLASHEILKALSAAGEKLAPEIKRDVDAIISALEGARETKSTGGLTRRAHQLLQRLRNPFFMTPHLGAAKQANNRLVKKTQKAFLSKLRETVSAFGLHQQALLEKGIYESESCGPPSREGIPVKDWEDLGRFTTAMEERSVPLHALGRMRDHEYDLFAQMVFEGWKDRAYQQPSNIWNRLLHAGFLEAFRGNMSDDECLLLAEAAARREEPEALDALEQLEKRLGRRLHVTPAFAASCQSLISRSSELWIGEADAIFEARAFQRSRQTEWLCKILAVPTDQKNQVEAFVGFVLSSERRGGDRFWEWDFLRHNLEEVTKAFERRHIPPAGWLPGLAQVFGIGESFAARRFKDPGAFWALYEFVLRNSETYRRLTEERDEDSEEARRRFQRDEREYLDKMGIHYILDEDGFPQVDPSPEDEEFYEEDEPVPFMTVTSDAAEHASHRSAVVSSSAAEPILNIDSASDPRTSRPDLFGDPSPRHPSKSKYGDIE